MAKQFDTSDEHLAGGPAATANPIAERNATSIDGLAAVDPPD